MKFSRSPGWRLIYAGLPVLILGLGAAVFLGRPPVLIVSDAGFDFLYGSRRTFIRQAGLSARLGRRVRRAMIAENANPEAAAFAIEEKSRRPWAVLGSSRYSQGLERYARQHPEVRVALIREEPPPPGGGGEPGPAPPGEPERIYHDVPRNSRRAGRSAALLAGEREGTVLVFQDGLNFPVDRTAFREGLREGAPGLNPVYLSCSDDYDSWDQVLCVVLGGPAAAYLERKDSIPAILYSWMDPALSSSNIKILGDDSPWALAFTALSAPAGEDGGHRAVPADFFVLGNRIGDPELRKRLKKAVK